MRGFMRKVRLTERLGVVGSIRIHKVDMTTGFRNEHKLRLIVSVLNPDKVISRNALDVLEHL